LQVREVLVVAEHRLPSPSAPENVATKSIDPELHWSTFIVSVSPVPPFPTPSWIGPDCCESTNSGPSEATICSVVSILLERDRSELVALPSVSPEPRKDRAGVEALDPRSSVVVRVEIKRQRAIRRARKCDHAENAQRRAVIGADGRAL